MMYEIFLKAFLILQDFVDFRVVLPSLVPVFASATGWALSRLVKHADILYRVTNNAAVSEV